MSTIDTLKQYRGRPGLGRGVSVARVVMMLRILSDGAYHGKLELARRLGCSSRTILRDLDILGLAGVPVEPEVNEKTDTHIGRYRLMSPKEVLRMIRFVLPAEAPVTASGHHEAA